MIRVLHVDDSEVEFILVHDNLLKLDEDLEVTWAESAEGALQLLDREAYDCILCDFQMPTMSGLDFIDRVRAVRLDTPCIFLTGHGNERVAAEALRAGADDYFTKDVGFAHFSKLRNSIVKLVEARRTLQEKQQAEQSMLESESLYRMLFESAGDPIFIISTDGTYLDINEAGCTALARPRQEIIGKDISRFERHEDSLQAQERIRDIVRRGDAVHETTIVKPDYTISYLESNARLISYRGEKAILSISRDITERKRFTEALWLRDRAIETSRSGMVFADLSGRITYVNQAVVDMWQLRAPAEYLGKSIFDFWFVVPDARRRRMYLTEILRRTHFSRKIMARRADGSPFWVMLSACVLSDPAGRPLSLFSSIINVSEEHIIGEQLREREKSISRIIDSINSGVIVYDTDYRITLINPKACEILETTAEKVLGASLTDRGYRMIDENSVSITHDKMAIRQALDTADKVTDSIAGFIHPDSGRTIWTEANVIPDLNTDGSLSRVIVTFHDFTGRKLAEDNLRIREHAINSSSIGIAFVDSDNRIFFANKRLLTLWDLDSEARILGTPVAGLLKDKQKLRRLLRSMKNKGAHSGEMTGLRANGESFNLLMHASTVINQKNEQICWMASFIDISERIRIEKELLLSRNHLAQKGMELERLNSELESFTFSVSHDLRSPLRFIEGYSGLLLADHGDQLNEEGVDYLHRISRAVGRMSDLINDLLQLSRTSRQELIRQEFDLAGVAESVMEEIIAHAGIAPVEFSLQKPLPVRADRRFLKVVLDNLLSNAVKFTRKNPSPKIEMGITGGNGEAEIYVRDNGVGFDPELSGQLFLPFKRLHPDTEYEGTGIGLSIVYRIIERHGGRIRAESAPGKGATFYFTLPEKNGETDQPSPR